MGRTAKNCYGWTPGAELIAFSRLRRPTILVLTPVTHLTTVSSSLGSIGQVVHEVNLSRVEFLSSKRFANVLFTNPNSSRFRLDAEVLDNVAGLQIVCTASTGTDHIDLDHCRLKNITVLSLKSQVSFLRSVTATAELAVTLSLSLMRNVLPAAASVRNGEWDYLPFLGQQVSSSRVGVLGLGRLGSIYAKAMGAMGAEVSYYDPNVNPSDDYHSAESVEALFAATDLVSVHVHLDQSTKNLISRDVLRNAGDGFILINTSRGEVVDESELVGYLKAHPASKYGTDVLRDERLGPEHSAIWQFMHTSSQVLITPHIGGMTIESQSAAFLKAVELLRDELSTIRQ